MTTRELQWSDIEDNCYKIAEQVLNTISPSSSMKVDAVIGLSRGGLVPATIIAHLLNVRKVLVHGYHSYDTDTNMRDPNNEHGVMYQDVVYDLKKGLYGKQFLIVDDLCILSSLLSRKIVPNFNSKYLLISLIFSFL